MPQSDIISFLTQDKVTIVGDLVRPSEVKRNGKAVLLLHMMPADRTSWRPLVERLVEAGFLTLAIDLRGHGASTKRGNEVLDYKQFQPIQHQSSRLDVDAAVHYLERDLGLSRELIGVVGASIGANLAIDMLARDARLKTAVALSPGLDYHGVTTEAAVRNLQPNQSIFLLASEEDSYSSESVHRLFAIARVEKEMEIYRGAGHGTNMWKREAIILDLILHWLQKQV